MMLYVMLRFAGASKLTKLSAVFSLEDLTFKLFTFPGRTAHTQIIVTFSIFFNQLYISNDVSLKCEGRKGKVYLYSASPQMPLTCSDIDHTG